MGATRMSLCVQDSYHVSWHVSLSILQELHVIRTSSFEIALKTTGERALGKSPKMLFPWRLMLFANLYVEVWKYQKWRTRKSYTFAIWDFFLTCLCIEKMSTHTPLHQIRPILASMIWINCPAYTWQDKRHMGHLYPSPVLSMTNDDFARTPKKHRESSNSVHWVVKQYMGAW
jgi:hypothetical protein